MEPRPKDKMPENPLEPIVRAVVFNTMNETSFTFLDHAGRAAVIARRLCETIDQDGWDHSDRVRRASTKLTWGSDTDG